MPASSEVIVLAIVALVAITLVAIVLVAIVALARRPFLGDDSKGTGAADDAKSLWTTLVPHIFKSPWIALMFFVLIVGAVIVLKLLGIDVSALLGLFAK